MNQLFRALRSDRSEQGFDVSIVDRNVADLPEGDVLIRVEWSSLNYKDALSATGKPGVTRQYPHTPGVDAAGVVVSANDGPWKAGDKVIVTGYDLGMNTDGGYGEYIRVPADWVVKLPQEMSCRDAMLLGTAGLTAALCVESLLDTGLSPDHGEVLVTGASGGVGAIAVALLAQLGFNVVAGTGKADAEDWLKQLGASSLVGREELQAGVAKALLKPRWAGVVDTVGGDILMNALKTLRYGASATCCGMAASGELHGTVFPFILRGINLLGVDSVELPLDIKQQVWEVLASEWRLEKSEQLLAAEVSLMELVDWFPRILAGQVRGRVLVRVAS
ncbi:YhdH/YhfP family quinone oxidoreductase [Alcanivorax sp. 1008]|uniref:YhdH/YhfP family quinone oxidoreductase n=1 Tax=Alcanivorax sp. 1008 TaxID=2816853 RepID=UPI001D92A73B|nr:YhdH/YhfP family quinone oxidoreductase [Alcanivorax sp. 1008]MCC1496410.1 YhdH/YhfP family quinone oxidoreductase [Alcanivorax sp. 1008]